MTINSKCKVCGLKTGDFDGYCSDLCLGIAHTREYHNRQMGDKVN